MVIRWTVRTSSPSASLKGPIAGPLRFGAASFKWAASDLSSTTPVSP